VSRAERDVAHMAPLVAAAAEHERRVVERARDLAARGVVHECPACRAEFTAEQFAALPIAMESDRWEQRTCPCGADWPNLMAMPKVASVIGGAP